MESSEHIHINVVYDGNGLYEAEGFDMTVHPRSIWTCPGAASAFCDSKIDGLRKYIRLHGIAVALMKFALFGSSTLSWDQALLVPFVDSGFAEEGLTVFSSLVLLQLS